MGFIYKIENLINHKKYIGLTTKEKPQERFREHIKAAKENAKYLIHQAIYKYGKENFSFEIIEEVPNEKLEEREIYWIAYYDTYQNSHKGYNMTPGGKAPKKEKYCKINDETILQTYFSLNKNGRETSRVLGISEDTVYRRLKEYNITTRDRHSIAVEINKLQYRPIWQIDLITLDIVKEWDSISQARTETKMNSGAIEVRKQKTSVGYYWCYANQESYNILLERIKNYDISKSLKYDIQQIDPKTNEVLNTFSSIKEATSFLGKNRPDTISEAIRGINPTAYGYCWKKILRN